ncbi:MAG: hypothetical protein ACR2GF_06845, partial [Acidimicrobiales bacterium]
AALLAEGDNTNAETKTKTVPATGDWGTTTDATQAVRDATTPAGPVRAGDWLGVTSAGIVTVGAKAGEAACALLDGLVGDDHELVTVVEGQLAPPGGTRQVTDWLAEHHPGLAVEVHDGGQPLTAWLLSLE